MQQNALNSKANDEIVIATSICIILYTMSTTPEEIDVCCEWLIENHPVLKDTECTSFVRWIKYYCKILCKQHQFRTFGKRKFQWNQKVRKKSENKTTSIIKCVHNIKVL